MAALGAVTKVAGDIAGRLSSAKQQKDKAVNKSQDQNRDDTEITPLTNRSDLLASCEAAVIVKEKVRLPLLCLPCPLYLLYLVF